MIPDEDKRETSALAKTLLVSGIFVLLAVAAGLLFSTPEWRLPPEPVLASKELPDGAFLIHRAEFASSMTIEGPEQVGGFQISWKPSSGGSRSLGRNGYSIRLRYEGKEDRLKSAELSPQADSLLLLVTAEDALGEPISSDLVRGKSATKFLEVERNLLGIFTNLDQAKTTSKPAYSLEIGDGSGGWLPMFGPLIIREADGRAFFSAPVFPRTSPTLRLRATIDTEKPVELEIPNPGYLPSVPALTNDPEPWERDLGEVTVRIQETVMRPAWEGELPRPWITWRVDPKEGNPQPRVAYQVITTAIEDQTGNSISRGPVLPGTRQIRVEAQVSRTDLYSYPPEDCLLIGEAVWGDGRGPLVFAPTTEASDSGIQTMVLKPRGATPKRGALKTTYQLDINAEYPFSARPPVIESLGSGRRLCFFIEEEPLSRGTASRSSHSSSRGGGASSNARTEMSFYWRLEDDSEPQPGQTIRIGLAPDLPDMPIEFVLPVERFGK